jgi:hypothetical protein
MQLFQREGRSVKSQFVESSLEAIAELAGPSIFTF